MAGKSKTDLVTQPRQYLAELLNLLLLDSPHAE